MTYRSSTLIVAVLLVSACAGCSEDSSPTAPSRPAGAPAADPPPAGTVVMNGTVSDTAYRPLVGATIEVLDGPQAGVTATADGRGQFSMSGVFDQATRFRATSDGHPRRSGRCSRFANAAGRTGG